MLKQVLSIFLNDRWGEDFDFHFIVLAITEAISFQVDVIATFAFLCNEATGLVRDGFSRRRNLIDRLCHIKILLLVVSQTRLAWLGHTWMVEDRATANKTDTIGPMRARSIFVSISPLTFDIF